MGDHPWVQWNVRDKFDSILQHKIGILIFFVHDTLPLSHTISAINYTGLALVNPNAPPLSIYFCIEGTFKKIIA